MHTSGIEMVIKIEEQRKKNPIILNMNPAAVFNCSLPRLPVHTEASLSSAVLNPETLSVTAVSGSRRALSHA
ncbi:hypothetical protein RRG08_037764 [Elysia crispata]|uniref:Uncharacterized protein n=1 Tax=Elysia crispata TaxID=231223 RepID=A0AAE1A852_9GAST|nr:hypothetical protein RRG08_037764 [Elysia crispata]